MTRAADARTAATSVAVVASSIPGEFLVPDLVDDFRRAHPEFEATVSLTDSAGVFDALRSGAGEVGFAGGEPDGADLVASPVATDEIVLAVPAGHEFAGGPVAIDRLTASSLVEREAGSGTRRSFTDALAERGTPLITEQPWIVRDSNDELLRAVAAGEGVGVVSAWALERHAPEDVVAARLDSGPVHRRLYLVLRDDAVLGPAATTFVEQVRAAAAS